MLSAASGDVCVDTPSLGNLKCFNLSTYGFGNRESTFGFSIHSSAYGKIPPDYLFLEAR